MRRRRAGRSAWAAWAMAVAVAGSTALAPAGAQAGPREGPRRPPRDSPLYEQPYRRGLSVEIAVGVALCQPALAFAGVCVAETSAPALPGVGLRLGAGWRFDRHWLVSAAWVRQGHRPGGSFMSGQADGVILAGRGIVPLATRRGADSRVDLGFELGLGWSQRSLVRDAAPNLLRSSGALLRPAIVVEGWVLADLAIGLELASQLNLHWRHCADDLCEPTPGPWMGGGLERSFVDGFMVGVRATGLVFADL